MTIRQALCKLLNKNCIYNNFSITSGNGVIHLVETVDQAEAEINEIHEKKIKRLKDRIKELQKFRDTEFCKRITTTLRNQRR